MVDLNSGSGFVYGAPCAVSDAGTTINALVDAALEAAHAAEPRRDYLGGSRVGEPCARRLAYEVTHTPADAGMHFGGGPLRIFEAGHRFEDLTIRWLQAAGFDLRTCGRDGRQFGFSIAGGRIRGHIDGVIVDGPDVGLRSRSTRRRRRSLLRVAFSWMTCWETSRSSLTRSGPTLSRCCCSPSCVP